MFGDVNIAGASRVGSGGSPSTPSASIWATCAPTVSVISDRSRQLVRAALSGMLTLDDVESFYRREQQAVQEMGCRSGEFLLLVETSGNFVQSQEVMGAFQRLIAHSPVKAKRVAIVREGALSSMQTRRIAKAREAVEVFDTVEAAEAWLFGPGADESLIERPSWAAL